MKAEIFEMRRSRLSDFSAANRSVDQMRRLPIEVLFANVFHQREQNASARCEKLFGVSGQICFPPRLGDGMTLPERGARSVFLLRLSAMIADVGFLFTQRMKTFHWRFSLREWI